MTETIAKRFETCADVRAWYASHFYGMPPYEHGMPAIFTACPPMSTVLR